MSDRKGGTAYIDVKGMKIYPYKCCISDQVCPLLARQHGEGKENGRLWWYDENFDLLAMLIRCVQVNRWKENQKQFKFILLSYPMLLKKVIQRQVFLYVLYQERSRWSLWARRKIRTTSPESSRFTGNTTTARYADNRWQKITLPWQWQQF